MPVDLQAYWATIISHLDLKLEFDGIKMKSIKAALVMSLILNACGEKESPIYISNQEFKISPEFLTEEIKNPKNNRDLYKSSKFIVEFNKVIPLAGSLNKFTSTDSRVRVVDLIAENSNIRDLEEWPQLENMQNSNLEPLKAIRTPLGDFVYTTTKRDSSNSNFIVVISPETGVASITRNVGAKIELAGYHLIDAVSMAIEIRSRVALSLGENPSPDLITKETLAVIDGLMENLKQLEGDAQAVGQSEKQILSESSSKKAENKFPNYVQSTWLYKPFSIISSKLNKEMSDALIAKKFLCKTPVETLQDSLDLLQNYDLIDTRKTDGTLTITSFQGVQQGKVVKVGLAVDEESDPRVVRYILVDGMPALNCY